MRKSPFDEAIARACQEPTMVDALSWICVWESERVVRQAHQFFNTGIRQPDGKGWDTCFRVCIKAVMDAYLDRRLIQAE